jgi:hypothetical protein
MTARWVDAAWRSTARASGFAIVAVVAVTILRPLFGASIIVFGHDDGGAAGTVVSTGIVPARVTAVGGTARTISDGQVAHVFTRATTGPRHYKLRVTPAYELSWILPILLLLAVPPALSLTVRDRRARAAGQDVTGSADLRQDGTGSADLRQDVTGSADRGEDAVGDRERDLGPLAQRFLEDELGRGMGAAAAWPEPVERQRD